MEDRIEFARSFISNKNENNFAKEISIIQYFDKLMAFYNLMASDYPNNQEGIQRYWFEDENKFILKIKFSNKKNLQKFCNKLGEYNGSIFIYGLFYGISYLIEEKNICSIELICNNNQTSI